MRAIATRTPTVTSIEFPRPEPRYMNMNDRDHHMRRADRVAGWRHVAAMASSKLGAPSARLHGRSIVRLYLPFKQTRHRDPMNYVATLKPILDGFVEAGVWLDDDSRYVVSEEPVLLIRPNLVGRVMVDIFPIPDDWKAPAR